MTSYDVLVIGGGMSGISLAYEIAEDRSVAVVEAEKSLAVHSSGRSAAVFVEVLGTDLVRGLTVSSRRQLEDSSGWFDAPAMTPLPSLIVARRQHVDAAGSFLAAARSHVPDLELVGSDDLRKLNPVLRPDYYEVGIYEPRAMEMDVHAIHSAYLRGMRRRGGVLSVSAGVASARRAGGTWQVTLVDGSTVVAETVVNAAGAWADVIGAIFGAAPIGLVPKRRCMYGVAAPAEYAGFPFPLTNEFESRFYFKPEGDGFLVSPVDETPQVPCDAKPDQLEIARSLDDLNEATSINARSVRTPWAGLRSFVADGHPVVGPDPDVEGFFWYAAQGGYGIQTSPALSRAGAAILGGKPLPEDIAAQGVSPEAMSPGRGALATARAGTTALADRAEAEPS
jgi:D-arginine dehydrogenase